MTILKKTAVAVLLLSFLICMALPVSAMGESCTLVIRYLQEEVPLTGARFQVYRVADFTEEGGLFLTGEFAAYPADTTVSLSDLAVTLYGYAAANGVAPIRELTVDASGSAVAEGLSKGVYLVVGLPYSAGGDRYVSQPQLVYLPWRATSADPWSYEVVMLPKSSRLPGEDLTMKVLKQWEDKGCEIHRPESIQVTLLRDGAVYETVTLDAKNNWSHTWQTLEGGHFWTVSEDVPALYTVSVTQEGAAFLVRNTCTEPPPTTEPPPPDIPQTGVTWWPVPLLAAAGLLLIALGLSARKDDRHEA